MRQFSADYLETTREGMWGNSREALTDLALDSRERILDVGCGTGELTRVLAEESGARESGAGESGAEVVGADVDPSLLSVAGEFAPVVRADATRLPFDTDAFDLVVCQALLINLPDPVAGVREFARASSDLVAAVEPDNGGVTVDSTVDAEPPLARRARERFLDGVETEVTLGSRASEVFEEAGLDVVSTRRYDHERVVSPPYSESAMQAAKRKATGEGLADDRETMLSGETSAGEYDDLRTEWRAMGRDVVAQMGAGSYVRTETVPFFVTVGRV